MTEPALPGLGPEAEVPEAELRGRVAACRSCGAPIIWCLSGNGKTMPVDAVPTGEGNVRILADEKTVRAIVGPGGNRLSHFATCPNAAQHRKPRKR